MKKSDKGIYKINCNTCLSLVSLFFSSGMSNTVRQAIVSHLVKCDRCLNWYDGYEKTHKDTTPDLKIKELILELRSNLDDANSLSDTLEIISSTTMDSNTDGNHFNPTKWTDAALNYDIEMLMNLKVFRDLINSYGNDTIDKNLDFSEFYKYITNKYAKRIDLLELCLRKEIVTNS